LTLKKRAKAAVLKRKGNGDEGSESGKAARRRREKAMVK
jgi:hypothetical protein